MLYKCRRMATAKQTSIIESNEEHADSDTEGMESDNPDNRAGIRGPVVDSLKVTPLPAFWWDAVRPRVEPRRPASGSHLENLYASASCHQRSPHPWSRQSFR